MCRQEPLRFLASSSVREVIRSKALLKDAQEGSVNSSVRRTRSSLRAMTTLSPYEGARRRGRVCVHECVRQRADKG